MHTCTITRSTNGGAGFDPATITTTSNGVDMLCAAMTLLYESGHLEAPDMALWTDLQRAMRREAMGNTSAALAMRSYLD